MAPLSRCVRCEPTVRQSDWLTLNTGKVWKLFVGILNTVVPVDQGVGVKHWKSSVGIFSVTDKLTQWCFSPPPVLLDFTLIWPFGLMSPPISLRTSGLEKKPKASWNIFSF